MKEGSREALAFFGFLSAFLFIVLAVLGIPAIAFSVGFGAFILPFMAGCTLTALMVSLMFFVVALNDVAKSNSSSN